MANNVPSLNTPYLALTGTVLIAVVFLFAVLQPMMDSANSLRHDVAADTETLKDKKNFLSSLDAKLQQLQAMVGVENQMAVVIPQEDRTQDIVRILNEYANQSGVTILTASNNSSTSTAQTNAARARGEDITIPTGVRTLAFEVSVTGAYEQIRVFLSLVGRSPRIMDVTGLSLKQGSPESGQVNANLTIQLYSQQTSQETGV